MKRKSYLVEIRNSMSGLNFPVPKERLVEYVRTRGVSDGVINIIEDLPRKTFNRGTEVIEELGISDKKTPRHNLPSGSAPKKSYQIPRPLPSFEANTLLIVASRQDAVFYSVHKRRLSLLDTLSVPTPRYSDREGHFKARSRAAGVIRAGAPRELHDEKHMIPAFSKELRKMLAEKFKASEFQDVYILVPSQVKAEIKKVVPKPLLNNVVRIIKGNHVKERPLRIVEIITTVDKKKKQQRRVRPMSLESRKILLKSRQARTVIKGKPRINT